MKNILSLIFSIFFYIFSSAQQSNVDQKNNLILDKISNDICTCYNNITDKSENYIDKLLLRECLEESTEQNIKKLLNYYNVKSYKEINLEKYLGELRPKMSEKCKLRNEFINETFETISTE